MAADEGGLAAAVQGRAPAQWGERRQWRRPRAIGDGPHHALPHRLLEDVLRVHPPHKLLRGMAHLLHGPCVHRHRDGRRRRARGDLRVHRRAEGLRHRHHLRGAGHLAAGHLRLEGRGPGEPRRGCCHRERDGLERGERVSGHRDPVDIGGGVRGSRRQGGLYQPLVWLWALGRHLLRVRWVGLGSSHGPAQIKRWRARWEHFLGPGQCRLPRHALADLHHRVQPARLRSHR
mmetsp:Transcript_29012/g.48696  ORF Transcript_29012/g.48696 Transcript_29012/m.48696 type:complete len:232 (-) Transcript_29012:846-1541(-)